MAFGGFLKADTAVDVIVGPFVDEDDGKTAETGLTIAQADVRLSKNGGNMAQKSEATALAHDEIGNYLCKLDTTDTNTEGILTLMIHESGALPVKMDYMVVNANVYDSLYAAATTDYLEVDIKQAGGTAITAGNFTSNIVTVTSDLVLLDTVANTIASDLLLTDAEVDKIYSDTTIIASDLVIVDAVADTIASDLLLTDAVIDNIYSDTTIIASDLIITDAAVDNIYSDTTIIASDLVIVDTVADTIASDLLLTDAEVDKIYSDTTIIASDLVIVDTVVDTVASDLLLTDAVADTVASDLLIVKAVTDNMEKAASTMVEGTVSHDNTVATTTVFYCDDITEATADHYNGRIVIFTSGDLQNQATDITDYALDTGEGKFTVTALTEAPADNCTFVIV